MGAFAGINAGGFYDPNGKGNGAFPDGLTVHDGRLVHNNMKDQAVNIVGFNDQGKLVIGTMTANQLDAGNRLSRKTQSQGEGKKINTNSIVILEKHSRIRRIRVFFGG